MDRLLSPGMRIMRRLDVAWKLVLIAVVLAVPLSISVTASFVDTSRRISQSDTEANGLSYLRPLLRLDIDLALMHTAILRNQATTPASPESLESLEDAHALYGRGLDVQDEWEVLKEALTRVQSADASPTEGASRIRTAMLAAQSLVRAVADESGLSLDEHFDTHYLVQTLTRDVPDLMWTTALLSEALDKVDAWPEGTRSRPTSLFVDDLQETRALGHQLSDRARRMSDDLADAWNQSGSSVRELTATIAGRLGDLADAVGRSAASTGLAEVTIQEVPGKPVTWQPAVQTTTTTSDLVVAARPLVAALDDSLHQLLQKRAEELRRGRQQPLFSIVGGLLLAGYLFAALMRATSRDAQAVLGDIISVTGGPSKPTGPLPGHDEFAQMSRAVEVTRDKLTSLLGALRYQATHDELTALGNRAYLVSKLEDALEDGGDHQVSVVLLDVVGFKDVNDSFGAAIGDRLLRTVGARMHRAVRRRDIVARLSGDNFGVLLPVVRGQEEVEEVVAALRAALADTVNVGGRRIRLQMNAGIAIGRAGTVSALELMRNADVARYASKEAGHGHSAVFEPWMHRRTSERAELSADLTHAVEGGQLRLLFQPLVDLRSGRVHGTEALVRWQHPSRGIVMPDVFVPLAEATGQIGQITRWVLQEAARQAQAWREEFADRDPLSIDVNVSAAQLGDDGVVQDLLEVLEITGIDPSQIVLEITESALVADLDVALRRLRQIAAIGVRIALDDFGTGYSSLSYLRRLPVSLLKLDKAFLRGIEDPRGRPAALVHSIIGLGTSLGIQTLAEGIEDAGQETLLRSAGCHLGQGYRYSWPLTAEAFTEVLRQCGPHGAWPVRSGAAPAIPAQLDPS